MTAARARPVAGPVALRAERRHGSSTPGSEPLLQRIEMAFGGAQ